MIAEKLRDLSHWTTDDGQDLVMVADVLELIREELEAMRQEIEQANIGCEQQMRPATPEERQGEKEYIDSISEPTGVNFNDLLKYDEEEWIDECFDKLYNAPTVEDKPQGEEKNICDSCRNKACIFDSHVKRQKCDFYKPQPKTEQFAKWVATEIFDENWKYNKDAFAEIACRKLAKLGIVRAKGDEWELVESEEV